MTASAVVRRCRADGSVELELEGRAGCAGCHGVCMWRLLPSASKTHFPTSAALEPGAAVLVRLPHRYVLLTSLLLYGVPLTGLLGGALLGAGLVGGDLGSLAGALGGLVTSLAATPGLRQRLEAATVRHLRIEPVP